MFRTLALLALPLIPAAAIAEEGMWLPNQTPAIGEKMRAAGLQMDPAKLGDFKAAPLNAIVSLGGCSAAFLSNQGLVVTNHHCVYGSIQYNSKAGQDYLTDVSPPRRLVTSCRRTPARAFTPSRICVMSPKR